MTRTVETQSFQLHPAILFDIINAQAGSPQKALLEAVMNAIDADATRCDISVSCTGFTVKDDGKGFGVGDEGRKAIDAFFKTFGTPHTDGDARYGRFRMGRGQLMAFGINTWRTGTFRMKVDIKNKGADYLLESALDPVSGCEIVETFYERLSAYELGLLIRELEKMVAFAEIPVTINEKVVSKPPAAQKWDIETNEAYFKFHKTGNLSVYNLGTLVTEHPGYKYGSGGIVVSKQRLNVNFARNDVLVGKCPVWKKLVKTIEHHAGIEVVKKKTLTTDDRQYLAEQILSGEYQSAGQAKVITDVAGRHHRISALWDFSRKGVTVAPDLHHVKGERIHASKAIFVIAPETLERFNCKDFPALQVALRSQFQRIAEVRYVDFDGLAALHSGEFLSLSVAELNFSERVAFKAIAALSGDFWRAYHGSCHDLGYDTNYNHRSFLPGESDVALAWTDGSEFVTLHRSVIKSLHDGLDDAVRIVLTLLHEACHDSASTGTHGHDLEFYERFHDLATSNRFPIARIAARMLDELTRILRREGRKPSNKLEQASITGIALTKAEVEPLKIAA